MRKLDTNITEISTIKGGIMAVIELACGLHLSSCELDSSRMYLKDIM